MNKNSYFKSLKKKNLNKEDDESLDLSTPNHHK